MRDHSTHSYWAISITVVVCILFGLFWYKEKTKIEELPLEPVSYTPLPHDNTPSPADLQASAEAIVIPDYTEDFQ